MGTVIRMNGKRKPPSEVWIAKIVFPCNMTLILNRSRSRCSRLPAYLPRKKWKRVYIKKVQIEARVLGDLSLNHIIPVAVRYQSVLLDNIAKLKETFGDDPEFRDMSEEPRRLVRKIAGHICAVTKKVDEMVEARKKANRLTDMREKAIAYHDSVAPYLDEIRDHIDDLELMVDNQMWPLPKYRELLFIR